MKMRVEGVSDAAVEQGSKDLVDSVKKGDWSVIIAVGCISLLEDHNDSCL